MLFTEKKLEARLRELSATRYRDVLPMNSFSAIEDEAGATGARPPAGSPEFELKAGETWKGRDRYIWLSRSVEIPKEWSGKTVLARFDLGETGGGNNEGFESLLYWNGAPYQGVDSNHQEVFLPEDCAGKSGRIDIRLWSGLDGGGKPREMKHTINVAELCWLDEKIDDFYYTGRAILETIQALDDKHPDRVGLLKALDRAFLKVDWSQPESDAYRESVYEAREQLLAEMNGFEKHHPVTVTAIGHTHIDVAWLWRLKHTREKCARSFSTVLRLMERFPDYVFLQTQPQLYAYIKQDYPEIYEQIRERVREGRWEIGGGMWLEADCNLTSGESLVRQFLFGTRFMRQEFGVESTYLWLPDVFGYSWALPQILRKSGFETFMTTKISWNQFNRMPHDTFKWRGIDGSEVLTHFITTPDDWEEANSFFYTYNGLITPQTVKGAWGGYQEKEVNQELLLSYGYGDGGGGVNREMLEMRRRLDEMPGLPNVKTGRADDYFQRLQTTFKDTDRYVHTWDGELYLEYHRGTYTSQAYNKRMNRKLELLYRETEWLSSLASVLRGDWSGYRQKELNEGWTIILRNQFHDIIPGSSIKEVYEDSREEYAEALALASDAWKDAAAVVGGAKADGAVTVLNSSPWERNDLVVIDGDQAPAGSEWIDAEGHVLLAQYAEDRWIVAASKVPSLGLSAIRYREGGLDSSENEAVIPFRQEGSTLKTPHYEIEWNEAGQLSRIYDLDYRRDVLAPNAFGNVLQVFEDKPLHFEAWDVDIFYQEKMREITDLVSVELAEVGPLMAVVAFRWKYANSVITQRMTVYADNRRIDFRTHINWQDHQQLLKVAFPVDVRSTEATYDIQFGNVKRPTHWNTSWDWARFESVGHQWADLSERGYGVSLLNDCKYGYDVKDNVLRLSLLKSAISPDPDADIGEHEFVYALYPHEGDWYAGGTVQQAWSLNNPLTAYAGAPAKDAFSLFRLSAANVMVDAVKKAEDGDGLILRVHEFAGVRSKVELGSDLTIASLQECNLMEQPMSEAGSSGLSFELKPYEIKTFIVQLQA
ncbi:alpha-mannosidase [Cohnella terricola]|uniref:Alpha-mannosidase n=1 Tax=Cohnella terricola TaxID=1289167 RepID=A0A559JG13_9BACL|nr:alpha-mannosidase [Cohnella terricola]TVX98808.1 alpha-mannosidase [Cohnella terricola]